MEELKILGCIYEVILYVLTFSEIGNGFQNLPLLVILYVIDTGFCLYLGYIKKQELWKFTGALSTLMSMLLTIIIIRR
ncbi:MAG: hypothetical protein IJO13_00370 [Lachnospiraceae bacterium]|nr:hypothetical protein [Lachnospiraceae bacterium]